MRLVLLNENLIGEELAIAIYLSTGMIFANEGTILSSNNIKVLKKVGIETVYIKDDNNAINLREILKTPIRLQVSHRLKIVFDNIKKNKTVDETEITNIADMIIDNLDVSENSFMLNNIGQRNDDFKLVTHSINVTILALVTGINMKYNRDKLEKLAIGAILHDVGKLFAKGERHCREGYDLIKNTRIPVTSYMCILRHHENEDGTGYPDKVPGNKIHEFAKVVSICDEYNNLLQCGKFALPSLAIEYITSLSGKKFSEDIFKNFIGSIYCYPNGLYVRLNDGKLGVVVYQNKDFPARPMVGIIENGIPTICNLMKNLTLFIEKVIL
ncbi:MAG: metal dependent phosphohydrolase [Clostridiaceae bacterium]|nr:metal dependent phosphohydrolase [Clostridiaceae bacterium]